MTAGPSESSGGEVLVYEAPDGSVRVDVRLERETLWLSQRQMADLFGTTTDNVGLHLKNIFLEGELVEEATTEESSVVQTEGERQVRRRIKHYNLDAILSVGYRVSSKRGTQFRIWGTRTLREHLLRGFTLHERRLRECGLGEVEQAVGLLARTLTAHALVTDEGQAVLAVVQRYTRVGLPAPSSNAEKRRVRHWEPGDPTRSRTTRLAIGPRDWKRAVSSTS